MKTILITNNSKTGTVKREIKLQYYKAIKLDNDYNLLLSKNNYYLNTKTNKITHDKLNSDYVKLYINYKNYTVSALLSHVEDLKYKIERIKNYDYKEMLKNNIQTARFLTNEELEQCNTENLKKDKVERENEKLEYEKREIDEKKKEEKRIKDSIADFKNHKFISGIELFKIVRYKKIGAQVRTLGAIKNLRKIKIYSDLSLDIRSNRIKNKVAQNVIKKIADIYKQL